MRPFDDRQLAGEADGHWQALAGRAFSDPPERQATAVSDPLRLAGDAFAGIADQAASHPLDSHPPLRARLDAIGVSLRDALAQARNASPQNPASNLLDAPDEEEERLSGSLQEWMRNALANANLRFETVGG